MTPPVLLLLLLLLLLLRAHVGWRLHAGGCTNGTRLEHPNHH
jgi:hypothetical protein